MKKAIIIGGGFAGCTAANFLKQKKFDVTIVEKSDVLGGGCRTHFYHGHPYTYGPHHLLINVNDDHVLEYVQRYLDLREMDHYNMTFVAEDRQFYTFPIHKDEISDMPDREIIRAELDQTPESGGIDNFEDFWIYSVGETLYDKFINDYSKKMWQIKNNKALDEFTFSFKNKKEDSLKQGSKKCFDGKKTVWYPTHLDGYNRYFDECVKDCQVLFSCEVSEFDIYNKRLKIAGQWESADIIVSTISLDKLFNYEYGELPYVGRDF